jgi:uncharacterized membrane protein
MGPIDDPLNYKWGILYFKKTDIRTVVPKKSRVLGWTFNFAKPGSYAFVGVVVLSSLF